jgi:hypothetical protein
MGLYKREKFHMYSPALYRLKSRQPGAFFTSPCRQKHISHAKHTDGEENMGGGRRYIHQFHKTVQSQYFGQRKVLGVRTRMGEKGGNYF